jgi:hypothetical protein
MGAGQYEQLIREAGLDGEADLPDGARGHVAGAGPEAWLVVEVWDDAEAVERTFERVIEPLAASVGVTDMAPPRIVPVHRWIRRGAGPRPGVMVLSEAAGMTAGDYDRMVSRVPAHAGDGSGHPSYALVAGEGPDGMLVAGLWTSEEEFQGFLDREIAPAAGGLPEAERQVVWIYRLRCRD